MDKKKTAAAIAAVTAAIKIQEEAAKMVSAQSGTDLKEARVFMKPAGPFNIWGISGRQQQMVFRANMQLRIYK